MLDIINNLTLFFEDNYAKINVRRYSRIMKISPPTASKLLKKYEEENLLESSKYDIEVAGCPPTPASIINAIIKILLISLEYTGEIN